MCKTNEWLSLKRIVNVLKCEVLHNFIQQNMFMSSTLHKSRNSPDEKDQVEPRGAEILHNITVTCLW